MTDLAPERRCVLSGESVPKAALIRLALGPDGNVAPDVRECAPGRGAWIGVDRATLEIAISKGKLKGALNRAFKSKDVIVSPDLAATVEAALQRHALDRLGLEARAGTLQTGSERIADAARKGNVYLLLHASDAAMDGSRKLDQAWRVGTDQEGSGAQGLVIAANRAMLAKALGRDNVVHIALTDRAAAARVGNALERWHKFIGSDRAALPCENDAQGSSAAISSLGV